GYDAAIQAPLMRLFLLAAIPLVLSVFTQMAIGLNKVKVIALSALAGSVVNLPVSCVLTARWGVEGVIWGTVLTTVFSNLLVPGVYVFRELRIDLAIYLKRTLYAPMAGAMALVAATWVLRTLMPVSYPGTALWSRSLPLLLHLFVGSMAYGLGYLMTRVGRAD